jgi:hypothetical protein
MLRDGFTAGRLAELRDQPRPARASRAAAAGLAANTAVSFAAGTVG